MRIFSSWIDKVTGRAREQKRLISFFEDYIPRDQIEAALDGSLETYGPQTSPGRIEFLLVLVNESNLEGVAASVGRVVDIAREHGTEVLGMEVSLLIIALGPFPWSKLEEGRVEKRRRLAAALNDALPGELAILHGSANGRFGIVGSPTRMNWTVLLPDFRVLLRELAAMQYGEVREAGTSQQS